MKRTEATAPTPTFDMRAFFPLDAAAMPFGDDAYRAWFDRVTAMQAQATTFWNRRLAKDLAVAAKLGEAQDPAAAWQAQVEFAREALEDYRAEGERMLALFTVHTPE